MIEIRRLTKTYPGQRESTLREVDLTLSDIGLYFLVGKSGSGKSTLLALLGGMDFDYEGEILVDGKDLKSMAEREREDYRFKRVCFAFQDFKAEETERVGEILRRALDLTDLSEDQKKERIGSLLRRVGLRDKGSARFQELSGGEKKRISLVRALVKEGDILLADEPLASLDPKKRKEILSLLVTESRRRLVLVITHEEREIPSDATLLRLSDGKIQIEKASHHIGTKIVPSYQRKRFSGLPFWKSMVQSLFNKRSLLVVVLSSLILSLFAIGFSFLLSGSVESAMSKALDRYMDEGSMVVSLREDDALDEEPSLLSAASLQQIERRLDDKVLAVTAFYLDSLNEIFLDEATLSLSYLDRSIDLPTLSFDSFLQFELPEESEGLSDPALDWEDLSHEDVVLGLDEASMVALYLLLFHEEPSHGITPETLLAIRRRVWYRSLSLQLQAAKGEWSYYLDHSYTVCDVFLAERSVLVSPLPDFHEHFVSEVLQFVEIDADGERTVPWTLRKAYGLRLLPGTNADFLAEFLHEEDFDSWTLEVVWDPPYYVDAESETHNRLFCYEDSFPRLSVGQIERFASLHPEGVRSVSYSSSVYTYTASGFISGFQKPFFFSPAKEKLNAIMDESSLSAVNLGSFQGSGIQVPDGVLKADLLSSMEEQGLRFSSLDGSAVLPLYGEEPSSYEEIGISEGMAEKLFGDVQKAAGETLHTLTLDRIVQEGEQFRNVFSEGSLRISGIYPGEEVQLFHHSLFPLCYAFSHTGLTMADIRIQEAILDCDLERKRAEEYLQEITAYGPFRASFPMLEMTQEIRDLLDNLSLLFLAFALLSLLSSAFLSALALFLIVRKDRKSIGILLSLGYRKGEILRYYAGMAGSLVLFASAASLLLGLWCEQTIQRTLDVLLEAGEGGFLPYLLPPLVGFLLLGALIGLLARALRPLSPKESFLKG